MSNNYNAVAGKQTATIGVLAVQGDFARHAEAMRALGATVVEVKRLEHCEGVQALIVPGGESTVFLRLIEPELKRWIQDKISAGTLPTLATCAGVILLAQTVTNPAQESLGCLDVSVARNDYGRQIHSFVTEDIHLTEAGSRELQVPYQQSLHGIFIRAPRITRVGPGVTVLAYHGNDPVLVKEGCVLAATFHPELHSQPSVVHRALMQAIH